MRLPAILLFLMALAACGSEPAPPSPPPAPLTREALGYFCGMIVLDHAGPKAQIRLRSRPEPLFFTSVRDAVAFTLLPGEPRDIIGFHVHDMGRAESWDAPGDAAWIDAAGAVYVIESRRRGGMGIAEAVPFGDRATAGNFVVAEGGRIVTLGGIPESYVLGDVDAESMP